MTTESTVQRGGAISAISPLLQHRWLRIMLLAAPGIMASVAILTAMSGSLVVIVALNVASGVIISSALFLAMSMSAKRVTEDRTQLARATEQEIWRARAMRYSIHHDTSGLYADWYFRVRMQEEIERSKRYGVPFAVLILRPIGLHVEAELTSAANWFADHIQPQLRRSDVAALMQDGCPAIIMPNTGRDAAITVQERVTLELAPVEPQSGLALYPQDGEEIASLLDRAIQRSLASPGNNLPPAQPGTHIQSAAAEPEARVVTPIPASRAQPVGIQRPPGETEPAAAPTTSRKRAKRAS